MDAKDLNMDPVPEQLREKIQYAESELQCKLDQYHAAMLLPQRAQEQQAEVVVVSSDDDDSAVPEDDSAMPAGKYNQ